MILEFKFKNDTWEKGAYPGVNYFILDPKDGKFRNFRIGRVRKQEEGQEFSKETVQQFYRRNIIDIII
jgi:hypothetical protein